MSHPNKMHARVPTLKPSTPEQFGLRLALDSLIDRLGVH